MMSNVSFSQSIIFDRKATFDFQNHHEWLLCELPSPVVPPPQTRETQKWTRTWQGVMVLGTNIWHGINISWVSECMKSSWMIFINFYISVEFLCVENLSVNGRWRNTGIFDFPSLFRVSHPYLIMIHTQLTMDDILKGPVLLCWVLTRSMQILFYFKCFSEYSSFTVLLVSVSYTYTSIPYFLDFRPIQTTTGHWVEFPVLYSRFSFPTNFRNWMACFDLWWPYFQILGLRLVSSSFNLIFSLCIPEHH